MASGHSHYTESLLAFGIPRNDKNHGLPVTYIYTYINIYIREREKEREGEREGERERERERECVCVRACV